MNSIKKAIFPVAGFGTRLLPATKSIPKEILPIIDKPLIQYAVEEAIASGITELIFITGRNKQPIEDHFDFSPELEADLLKKGKYELLSLVQRILPKNVHCIYIRQSEPLGLGHAILTAAPIIGDEAFAVLLADDLLDSETPVLKQLICVAKKYQSSVIGVEKVQLCETNKYGIISFINITNNTKKITNIIEKPAPEFAPSKLAVVGRYLFEAKILNHLKSIKPGLGQEIQLTDGIASLLTEKNVLAYEYEGQRYDCGSKVGMLKANIALGKKYHGIEP